MNQTHLPALRRLLPLLLLLLALPVARGQTVPPPGTMSFQGYLTDQSGMPLGPTSTGPKNYTVVFRIFDAATGGNELHGEQQTVTVNNGYFSILLGQGSPYASEANVGNNLASVFTGPTAASRYVEMMVVGIGAGGNNVTIAPRLKLVASPYAYLAANAVNAATASSLVNTNNNNTAVVTVAPNGNLGIGTTTPNQFLEVGGAANVDGPLSINYASQPVLNLFETTHSFSASLVEVSYPGNWSSSASPGDLVLRNLSGKLLFQYGGAGPGLTIDTQNRVGIGTTTPASPLEIDASFNSSPMLTLNQNVASWGTGANYGNYRFIQTTTADVFYDGPFRQFNVAPGGVSIGYSTTPPYGSGNALYVNGFVGIGTTNPACALDLSAAGGIRARGGAPAAGGFGGNGYAFANGGDADSGMFSDGDGVVEFYANSSEVMRLNNTGLGIGTTAPGALLQVGGNARSYGTASSTFLTSSAAVGQSIGNNITLATFGFGAWGHAGSAGIRATTVSTGNGDWGNVALSLGYDVDSSQSAGGALWIYNGHIGIGTSTPRFPLDVEYSSQTSISFGYFNSSGNSGTGSSNPTVPVSIWASARIVAGGEFDAVSDARIKQVVGRSDTKNDLATVRQLPITDYRKIDKVQFGGRLEKGVIAQEIEKIIPEAVTISTNVIPNIYALAKSFACTNDTVVVTTAQPHGLVVGDVVKLITDTGMLNVPVTAVSSPQDFSIVQPGFKSEHLFVFGKQVGDFRTVNYDRLFTTGLGAIQELAKRAEAADARAERLSQRVEALAAEKKNVAELERKAAQVDELSRQVAELKKLVVQLAQPNAAHTTARTAADASSTVAATSR